MEAFWDGWEVLEEKKRKQSHRCSDNGNRLCVQAYSFKLCDNLFILLSNLSSLFAIILLSAFTHIQNDFSILPAKCEREIRTSGMRFEE